MRTLKKYPNRRIYDTSKSAYITLADVRQMVIDRQAFKVIDSRTGDDLTRAVLLQVIAEMEAEGHESLLTNRVLEELIRFYGDRMVGVLGPFLERQVVGFLSQQDRLREHLRNLSSGKGLPGLAGMAKPDQLIETVTQQYQQILKPFYRKRRSPQSKSPEKAQVPEAEPTPAPRSSSTRKRRESAPDPDAARKTGSQSGDLDKKAARRATSASKKNREKVDNGDGGKHQ